MTARSASTKPTPAHPAWATAFIRVAEYVRNRERLEVALRETAALAERAKAEEADRRQRAERAALARELHDIAGHHLTGIIVSAQAATALAASDAVGTRALLQHVQDDARTALADLRGTVGLLRDDSDPDAGRAPASLPTIERIADLVHEARARGQEVELHRQGEMPPLSPLAETAAYRMVQESLANAARHAARSPCRVHITADANSLRIAVSNDLPDAPAAARSTGYGLAGMRERADLIGARLTTGPDRDGGWRNELTIPRDHSEKEPE